MQVQVGVFGITAVWSILFPLLGQVTGDHNNLKMIMNSNVLVRKSYANLFFRKVKSYKIYFIGDLGGIYFANSSLHHIKENPELQTSGFVVSL